jgi:hypothetical protein
MKRLPNAVVSAVSLVATMVISVVLGAAVAVGIVVTWFNNTRGDGYAVFLITSISTGIFVSLVTFTALVSSHHVPAGATVALSASAWIVAAAYLTWDTCRSSYIYWDNWRWIMRSADVRAYDLNWIITGWLAIGVAGSLGLFVSRTLLRRASPKSVGCRDKSSHGPP